MHPSERNTATFWRPLLRDTARELGIPVLSDQDLYAAIQAAENGTPARIDLSNIDLVISFLFWKKILPPLIKLPRLGCFNFHPGPLPEFRGRRGYNFAILENAPEYGGTVHWVSEGFDKGDLVEVRTFPIRHDETALSLEQRTMGILLEMFKDFMGARLKGEPVPRIPQGPGKSATTAELLAAMEIRPEDDLETVSRKVRAFWYPPHTGATIEIAGRRFTLVDEHILSMLGRFVHGSRAEPF